MGETTQIAIDGVAIEIGGVPIFLRSHDERFRKMLEDRYCGFLGTAGDPRYEFQITVREPSSEWQGDDEVRVELKDGSWRVRRGDFRADWDPRSGRGSISQSVNPYAIDSVLRIVHSLILAREGGFLVHAASAIRHGDAFLFAGPSGAGKTTISRLAPPDAVLLTDEISYVRRKAGEYYACGTPFAGELAKVGENASAPLKALFLLSKGQENRVEQVSPADAVRQLLRNVLFFAEDRELVERVFQSACEFVRKVPVHRLIFVPDQQVWDLIG
jgi:hypothetical protein